MKRKRRANPNPAASAIEGENLRISGVARMLSVSISQAHVLSRQPDFPRPFRLSDAIRVWDKAEILAWRDARRAA